MLIFLKSAHDKYHFYFLWTKAFNILHHDINIAVGLIRTFKEVNAALLKKFALVLQHRHHDHQNIAFCYMFSKGIKGF